MLITFYIWRIFIFIEEERVKIQQHITWVNIIIFTGVKVNLSISNKLEGGKDLNLSFFTWQERVIATINCLQGWRG